MKEQDVENAKQATSELLVGAQFDRFTVSSLVVNICFVRLPKTPNLPIDIWLSATGQAVFIEEAVGRVENITPPGGDDFFDSRAKFLGQIYYLIGKKVTEVDIDPNGVLELSFEKRSLIFARDETDLEEIWSVTSKTPDPYAKQEWAITLTDDGQLVTRKP